MKLFECDGKELFRRVGIPVPAGRVATSPAEAFAAAAEIGRPVVVKAQVLAGGRGKAGAVRKAGDSSEAGKVAAEILGTTVRGMRVSKLLVEEQADIKAELYFSLVLDKRSNGPVLILGSTGGMDVEEIARTRPHTLSYIRPRPGEGLYLYQVRNALRHLGLPLDMGAALKQIGEGLLSLFNNYAVTLAEINPLAVTGSGGLVALDSKIMADDNCIAMQPFLCDVIRRDSEVYGQEEIKIEHGFDYVDLDGGGNVGLLTTGAGLTMAVVDMLKDLGCSPVNFVDIRTGALHGDPTRLVVALKRVLAAPNLKAILINVFAGITDLVDFSATLLKAFDAVGPFDAEVVVRIQGDNVDRAIEVLSTRTGVTVFTSLDEALRRVLKVVTG